MSKESKDSGTHERKKQQPRVEKVEDGARRQVEQVNIQYRKKGEPFEQPTSSSSFFFALFLSTKCTLFSHYGQFLNTIQFTCIAMNIAQTKGFEVHIRPIPS